MKQKVKIKLENKNESENNNSNPLEAKINSIISPNQDLSYNYLKSILLRLPDKDNANTICDYVLAMVQEFNISPLTRSNIIIMLYRHIKYVNKKFSEITHEDINMYLQSLRNSQDEAQKWIGTYNLAIAILQKFYKWLYYPKISSEIRALPECVSGFKKIKRKELARYSPNDMWTMEEHATFLKYCPSVRMRAYHAMALDTSARPHELLKLKIKDLKERVIPSVKDKDGNVTREECVVFQFVVSGKTGSRALALTNSMPYVKKWLEEHPQRQNKDAYVFINRLGNAPGRNSLFKVYIWYKNEIFPKLLRDQNVPLQDKQIIQRMLDERKWNPYVIRHSALTIKAKNRMMSDTMLRQHAGWSKESKMPSVYIHNYGSESVDELLRIQGYLPREDNNFDFNPLGIKKCGNCGTHNLSEAISCSKCKLLIDAVAYQHILKEQEEKDQELSTMKKQFNEMQSQMKSLLSAFSNMKEQSKIDNMAKTLYGSGLVVDKNNNKNKKNSDYNNEVN